MSPGKGFRRRPAAEGLLLVAFAREPACDGRGFRRKTRKTVPDMVLGGLWSQEAALGTQPCRLFTTLIHRPFSPLLLSLPLAQQVWRVAMTTVSSHPCSVPVLIWEVGVGETARGGVEMEQ